MFFSFLMFFLSDFFGHLSSFLKHSVSFYSIIKYYFYYTPFVLYYASPLIFALANLITLGFMSMRNEIIVMRSSGINIFRISAPILILSIIFGGLMFLSDEYVVGRSLDKAYYIKSVEFGSSKVENLWSRKGDFYINVAKLDAVKSVGYNVRIFDIDNALKSIVYAHSIEFKKNQAVLNEVEIVDMKKTAQRRFLKTKTLHMNLGIRDFLESPQKNDYSIKELLFYITHSSDRSYYLSILMFKVFYPISPFILTLLSLVFVLRITPRKSDFIKNVFFGGIIFVTFIGTFAFIISLGKLSIVYPITTILIFLLFWLAISVYNLLKLGI